MNLGILGSGEVAQALAAGGLKHGHAVMLGTRTPAKLADWTARGVRVGGFADAAAFGDVLILAVKGAAAADALRAAGAAIDGKPVIDATNPTTDDPPQRGVLRFFTGPNDSLMERLQREFPRARFVKAFSCVGSDLMVDPKLAGAGAGAGGRPTMFICGDNDAAKRTVTTLLDQFGWDAADMGGVEAARAIEPLAILWCIPGFLRNEWRHAFKLLK